MYTLRQHWDGPIDVLAWPESYECVKKICNDPILEGNAVEWTPNYRGKNDTFVDKTRLVQDHYDNQIVLFLRICLFCQWKTALFLHTSSVFLNF